METAAVAEQRDGADQEETGDEQQQQQQQPADADGLCGIFSWHPSCLQPLRRFILLFCCLVLSVVATSLLGTYHNAMVSTFEKRFEWKTRTVGFLLSSNDYGYLATVLFTAHYGSMSHRPRLMAVCTVLYGLSGIIFFLPYLIFGAKFTTEQVFKSELNASDVAKLPLCVTDGTQPTGAPIVEGDVDNYESNVAFVIFLIGGIIQGIAVGPFWNVTFAFIDDMTKQWSGVFIGLFTLLRATGPVFAYQLGSATTKVNEDLSGTLSQFSGTQKSPLWIGAWWLGYLLTGAIVLAASIPLFFFPASVPLKISSEPIEQKNPVVRLLLKQSQLQEDILQQEELGDPESRKQEKSFIGLLRSLKRLFKNRIFICLLFGNFFEFVGLNIPVNYYAKYMEHHFDVTQSEASSITGLVLPLGFGCGLLLSILISYRFQMSMVGLAKFHAFVHLFGILRGFSGLLFTCPTPNVLISESVASDKRNQQYLLNGSYCGSCDTCSGASYFPVCDGNRTFYSPCAAGCADSLSSGCSCAALGWVRTGTCEGACYTSLTAYAFSVVFLSMLGSCARTQEAVINLRCVQPRDKALSLACSSLMWGLISSFLPAISGAIFDSICVINSSDGRNSYCEMYDRDKFRYAFHLLSIFAQAIACIFFFLIWYYCWQRYGDGGDGGTRELPMGHSREAATDKEEKWDDDEEAVPLKCRPAAAAEDGR